MHHSLRRLASALLAISISPLAVAEAEEPASEGEPKTNTARLERNTEEFVSDAEADAETTGTEIIVTDDGIVFTSAGEIRIVSKHGGKARRLAAGASDSVGLASDGSTVYATYRGSEARHYSDGVILAMAKGRPSKTLVSGLASPTSVAVDAQTVFWLTTNNFGRSSLAACAKNACKPTELLKDQPTSGHLLVDETNLYWSTDRAIFSLSKTGGDPVELMRCRADRINGLAMDATNLYIAGSNAIQAVPKTGGPAVTIVPDVSALGQIAVDDAYVYWVDTDGLQMAPKEGGAPDLMVDSSALLTPLYVSDMKVDDTHVYLDSYREMGGLPATFLTRVPKQPAAYLLTAVSADEAQRYLKLLKAFFVASPDARAKLCRSIGEKYRRNGRFTTKYCGAHISLGVDGVSISIQNRAGTVPDMEAIAKAFSPDAEPFCAADELPCYQWDDHGHYTLSEYHSDTTYGITLGLTHPKK